MRPLAKAFPLLALLGLLTLFGCKKESAGLYEPNPSFLPTPTISSISPAGSAFSGMDTIVVTGTNFSPVAEMNKVLFGSTLATVLSSTPMQITLRAPVVTMDSVAVRVQVAGALLYSNFYPYKLIAGSLKFGRLDSTQSSVSLGTDATGNLYAAFCTEGKDGGIMKITAAGVPSTYANATASVSLWTGLKMGPAGYLYVARNFRAIYRIAPGGGGSGVIWLTFPSGTYINDIDFDQDGNLWGGGNMANIVRVDRNSVIATFPFAGNIHSVRVFNGYLYFAAKVSGAEKIWRAPITAGALGTPEVFFDFGASYPTSIPQAITFSFDGTLFIGTNTQEGLIIVEPGKAPSSPFTAYQSLFTAGIGYLAWGSADDLYASTLNGTLLRFIIRGKTSAPYYGSTL